jgi:hypothetical protein
MKIAQENEAQAEEGRKAAHRDCGPAGIGCFDPGQAVSNVTGAASQAWNTVTHNGDPLCIATLAIPGACGVIQAAEENPAAAAVAAVAGTICLAALEACAGAILGYTLAVFITDLPGTLQGKPPLEGWNPADALLSGAGAGLLVPFTSIACDVMCPMAGFGVGFAGNLVSQKLRDPLAPPNPVEAICAGIAGMGSTQVENKFVGFAYGALTEAASGACRGQGWGR